MGYLVMKGALSYTIPFPVLDLEEVLPRKLLKCEGQNSRLWCILTTILTGGGGLHKNFSSVLYRHLYGWSD